MLQELSRDILKETVLNALPEEEETEHGLNVVLHQKLESSDNSSKEEQTALPGEKDHPNGLGVLEDLQQNQAQAHQALQAAHQAAHQASLHQPRMDQTIAWKKSFKVLSKLPLDASEDI